MLTALAAAFVLAPGPVVDSDPAPPPSRIVFASARTGVAQLYSVEPSGEGAAQLTSGTGNWSLPVPSPDGRFVAAFRGPDLWLNYDGDLAIAPRPELWVMRADGTGARLLATNAAGVSWSGDSRRLAYVSRGIWTASVAGGRPRRITRGDSDGPPSLSPDGRSIAFVRYSITAPMLIVSRNGHERVISRDVDGQPFWSPNGKWIALRGADAISLVRTTGRLVWTYPAARTYCILACAPPGVAWSPDSRLIAYGDGAGIKLVATSGGTPRLLVDGALEGITWIPQGVAWSPFGDGIAFATRDGVRVVTLDGRVRMLVRFGPGEPQPGVGWSSDAGRRRDEPPQATPLLVQVSPRELRARFPIRQFSADGDRVAYWLCPHSLGAWRPGDGQSIAFGPPTLAACRVPSDPVNAGSSIAGIVLAGDRLVYLTRFGYYYSAVVLATLDRRDEGTPVVTADEFGPAGLAQLDELLGGGSTVVYGAQGLSDVDYGKAESIWRLDGATPVQIARRSDDLQPLAVGEGRIVARRADGALDLLGLDGTVLATFSVPALGAALAGDDLVVLVQGALRDYSVATGQLLHEWPLPDVSSAGRCWGRYCPPVRLTLDDAARGLVVYTLDGTVHLLRLRDGADRALADATAAELTDAGLFYAYAGEEPWPGRIRFVPFAELPL